MHNKRKGERNTAIKVTLLSNRTRCVNIFAKFKIVNMINILILTFNGYIHFTQKRNQLKLYHIYIKYILTISTEISYVDLNMFERFFFCIPLDVSHIISNCLFFLILCSLIRILFKDKAEKLDI